MYIAQNPYVHAVLISTSMSQDIFDILAKYKHNDAVCNAAWRTLKILYKRRHAQTDIPFMVYLAKTLMLERQFQSANRLFEDQRM